MKKTVIWLNYSVLCSLFGLVISCVPTSQFNELKGRSQKIGEERDNLVMENEGLTVRNAEMTEKITTLEREIRQLETETNETKELYIKLKDEYDHLNRKYEDLLASQETLLKGHDRETRRLLTELQKTQQDLQTKEDRLKDLEQNASRKMHDLERLRIQLEERNQRLIEMERILYSKDSLMNALKNSILEALYGFEKEGLSVTSSKGKVYVSMEEKLLFKTGSIEVDPRGASALKKLATILEINPEISITIEGHTDDVPVRTNPSYKDNWDLSVKRATSVVRILLANSSIDPARLVASGRGEYLPVDPGTTDEARQKNRRTEIILTPRLDELYKILESD